MVQYNQMKFEEQCIARTILTLQHSLKVAKIMSVKTQFDEYFIDLSWVFAQRIDFVLLR